MAELVFERLFGVVCLATERALLERFVVLLDEPLPVRLELLFPVEFEVEFSFLVVRVLGDRLAVVRLAVLETVVVFADPEVVRFFVPPAELFFTMS